MTTNSRIPRIAVFISGRGRSLKNLISFSEINRTFSIAFVVSSKKNSLVLGLLKESRIPVKILSFLETIEEDVKVLQELDERYKPDLYVLAGFLRKLPIPSWLKGKVINIHPSLLPQYGGQGMYGNRVHQAVLDANEEYSGATVHWADEDYDSGRLISQIKVRISDLNDVQEISDRVFAAEKILLPYVIECLT